MSQKVNNSERELMDDMVDTELVFFTKDYLQIWRESAKTTLLWHMSV